MASNLLNTLEKIEKGRKKCIRLANEVNYPLPEDASLEQIAQCINAQGYADEYYADYKAWFSKDFSALPDGKVRLPDDLETLGNKAFYYAENIDFIWPRNLKKIGQYTFCQSSFKNKLVDIPNTVTTINAYAFDYCKGNTINVPSSVTSIGNYAFGHSSTNTVINFDGRIKRLYYIFTDGNSSGVGVNGYVHFTDEAAACVETIGSCAFQNRILSKNPWNANTKLESSHGYCFQSCAFEEPVVFPKHFTPDGVETYYLSSQALQYAQFRGGFEFEEGVPIKGISSYAMDHSKYNTSILRFPETLEEISTQGCLGMSRYNPENPTDATLNLDRIEVPNKEKLHFTGNQGFYMCRYNHLIIYAKDLKLSMNQLFAMSSTNDPCGNIVFLNMKTVPSINSNTFNSSNLSKGGSYVYLPDDLVAEAKSKTYWSNIASYIKPLSEWALYDEYKDDIIPREEV